MSQQIDFSNPRLQEKLEAELSKFLLGDKQKEAIFDKLGKFIKYSKKKSDKHITSYYMKMREYFYMFNFDGLVENIHSKYLGFHFDFINFEFEDNWDASIFCATIGSLKGDFSLREWNNF